MPRLVCACVICKPPKTGFLASRPNISRIYTSKRKFIKMLHKDQCSNSVTTEFGVNKLIFTLIFSKSHVINILYFCFQNHYEDLNSLRYLCLYDPRHGSLSLRNGRIRLQWILRTLPGRPAEQPLGSRTGRNL